MGIFGGGGKVVRSPEPGNKTHQALVHREEGKGRMEVRKGATYAKHQAITGEEEIEWISTEMVEAQAEDQSDGAMENNKCNPVEERFEKLQELLVSICVETKQEIRAHVEKEINACRHAVQNELDRIKEEMGEREKERIVENRLLKIRVAALEKNASQQRETELSEAKVKSWIKEEVEKIPTNHSPGNVRARTEKGWMDRMEKRVEEIAKEQSRGDTGKLIETIDSKLERQERQNRRSNIIIKGAEFKGPNLKEDVEEFFEKMLRTKIKAKKVIKLKDADGERRNRPRIVLVLLNTLDEKKSLLRNRGLLKGTIIFIDDDFTRKEREIHRQIWARAKEEEKKGSRVIRGYMKLIINGRCWRWNEQKGRLENPDFRREREESRGERAC